MLLSAVLVHIFTALGSICALLSAVSFIDMRPEAGFAWLGVAFVVDGIDGTFARGVRVKERLPRFNGETLDLVIDYATYVFVPALALLQFGRLGSGWLGVTLASIIVLSSLYHFADERSKDADYHFVGFPAVWNVVAFYVFALGLSVGATAALVVACAALTFVPWPWVHPLRVVEARLPTLVVTLVWGVAAVLTTASGFPASRFLQLILVACAAYGVGLSLWWRWRAR